MDLKKIRLAAFALLVLLLLIVIFRNLEETAVELIFATVTMPLAALLLVTLGIGFGLGFFANTLWKVRRRRRAKSKRGSDE